MREGSSILRREKEAEAGEEGEDGGGDGEDGTVSLKREPTHQGMVGKILILIRFFIT